MCYGSAGYEPEPGGATAVTCGPDGALLSNASACVQASAALVPVRGGVRVSALARLLLLVLVQVVVIMLVLVLVKVVVPILVLLVLVLALVLAPVQLLLLTRAAATKACRRAPSLFSPDRGPKDKS